MDSVTLKICQIENAKDLELPKYQTKGSAGMDLHANVTETFVLKPFERGLVSVGIKLSIPDGYEVQLRPRSSLALKNGITLLNTPATIDSDYRGEIKVCIINLGDEDFSINRGDRIAQMVLCKVEKAELVASEVVVDTERGEGGFGSTNE